MTSGATGTCNLSLAELAKLARLLSHQEIDPRALGCYLGYLSTARDRSVAPAAVADEFDVPVETAESVLYAYRSAGALTGNSGKEMEIQTITSGLQHLTSILSFLTESVEEATLEHLERDSSHRIDLLYTIPADIDLKFGSTITGTLVDLMASADEELLIVNPFFTSSGLDLILDAFASAIRRGVRVTIVGRDIEFGKKNNRSYYRKIRNSIAADQYSLLQVVEINTERYPDASLHAKVLVSDRTRAYIGSANITNNSLRSALEVGVGIEGTVVTELAEIIDQLVSSDLFHRVNIADL